MTLDPQSAVGCVNLGQIHQIQGENDAALRLYTLAIKIDPTLLSAQESAAYLGYEEGSVDQARGRLEEAARLAPSGSPAAQRVGALLGILAERAGSGDGWQGVAALRRGDLQLVQGNRDRALGLYREAAGDPRSAPAARQMLERLNAGGK